MYSYCFPFFILDNVLQRQIYTPNCSACANHPFDLVVSSPCGKALRSGFSSYSSCCGAYVILRVDQCDFNTHFIYVDCHLESLEIFVAWRSSKSSANDMISCKKSLPLYMCDEGPNGHDFVGGSLGFLLPVLVIWILKGCKTSFPRGL